MKLRAHAKVNLGLHVLGRRTDGYHELDTVFARLDLHDTLTLEPRDRGIVLEIIGADLPAGQENLAYRAADAYLGAAGVEAGVNIKLEKRIPLAAGLGGGSSNAAAVLRGLNCLYPACIDLLGLGKELGADVPFFVQDWPAARAKGIGEKLEKLELPPLHLVLVNPGMHVSAREAYEALLGYDLPLGLGALLTGLRSGRPGYRNSLQPGVVAHYPMIASALEALAQAGLQAPLMSGSGATCFALAKNTQEAKEAARNLLEHHPSWWVRPGELSGA